MNLVKRLLPVGGLLLGVLILGVSLWRQNVRQIEKDIGSDAGVDQVGVSHIIFPEPVILTDEPLILPDHPSYLIQMVRDRAETWIAREERQRIKLSISHAGARLKVAQVLFSRGKVGSAAESFLKAERYLSLAVDELKIRNNQGGDYGEEWLLVINTARIHEETLDLMLKYVPKGKELIFSKVIEENRRIQDEARGRE